MGVKAAALSIYSGFNRMSKFKWNKEVDTMISKIKSGYRVMSESGRNMGTYKSLEEAKKRLKQIEFFKHKKKS